MAEQIPDAPEDYTALVAELLEVVRLASCIDLDSGSDHDLLLMETVVAAAHRATKNGRVDEAVDAIASLERQLAEVRGERDEALADSRLFARVRKKQSDHDTELIEGFKAERDRLAARCGGLERALREIIANNCAIVGSSRCRVESDGEYAAIARAALQEPQI